MRECKPLIRGQAAPLGGSSIILIDSIAGIIAETEHVLRHSIALFRRLSIPLDDFRIIPGNTIAVEIAISKVS